jgi:hypothetical protein
MPKHVDPRLLPELMPSEAGNDRQGSIHSDAVDREPAGHGQTYRRDPPDAGL